MDQRAPYRCQHGQLNGLGPQCYSRCRQVVEPAPIDPRDSLVTHVTKDKTAAVRRARWRKKNPEQHATQQRAARARRKATTQTGKVGS